MIVFGDETRCVDPRHMLEGLRALIAQAMEAPPGVIRHDLLVAALIEAGQLVQGIADAEMRQHGRDRRSPLQAAAMSLLLVLAQRVGASWEQGFAGVIAPVDDAIEALAACDLPSSIAIKEPEGFAHYALYPEAFFVAGRGLPPNACVIGLRSIGTSLAAMVAAGAGAPAPVTLRPIGPPFRREFALDPDLLSGIVDEPVIAIVDEGPGLSGSSMNGLADVLEQAGVPPRRIAFFPGHRGDLGHEAAPDHRLRWATADRRVVDFDTLIKPRLALAVRDLPGAPSAPLKDISSGRWRSHLYGDDEAAWPPIYAMQEKRKFFLRGETEAWRLKFVGLGRRGMRAHERAMQLYRQGLGAEPLGLRLGFLVERWHDDAVCLGPALEDRSRVLAVVGHYLGVRATLSAQKGGAGIASLAEMAAVNILKACGEDWAQAWRHHYGDGRDLPAPRRVETDNRLHLWEWLRLADGRIIKTDGLDHHCAHDLIGCQDIAWDIAGVTIEFACTPAEIERLVAMVEAASGHAVDRALLHWYGPAYLAFQIGLWTMARAQAEASEARRIDLLLKVYKDALAFRLFAD